MALKCAVLDDYQHAATRFADWGSLGEQVELTVFTDHLTGEDALVQQLAGADVVVLMREERTLSDALRPTGFKALFRTAPPATDADHQPPGVAAGAPPPAVQSVFPAHRGNRGRGPGLASLLHPVREVGGTTFPICGFYPFPTGAGAFGDLFTHTIVPGIPLVFDLSRISQTETNLRVAALLACWSADFGAMTTSNMLAHDEIIGRRRFLMILDEPWPWPPDPASWTRSTP